MRLNRFYIPSSDRELRQELWIDDQNLVHQWQKVLRFKVGDELILFDESSEKIYRIDKAEEKAFRLLHVTDMVPQKPGRHVYLFWSMLKKDKNDWVLQKCTELGVRNFVPIVSERTESTHLDEERANKIVIEAVEQCGRGDIPVMHEPMSLAQAVETYADKVDLYFAHVDSDKTLIGEDVDKPMGIIVGPEGGWSDADMQAISSHNVSKINIAQFTLRAETACIVGAAKLLEPLN